MPALEKIDMAMDVGRHGIAVPSILLRNSKSKRERDEPIDQRIIGSSLGRMSTHVRCNAPRSEQAERPVHEKVRDASWARITDFYVQARGCGRRLVQEVKGCGQGARPARIVPNLSCLRQRCLASKYPPAGQKPLGYTIHVSLNSLSDADVKRIYSPRHATSTQRRTSHSLLSHTLSPTQSLNYSSWTEVAAILEEDPLQETLADAVVVVETLVPEGFLREAVILDEPGEVTRGEQLVRESSQSYRRVELTACCQLSITTTTTITEDMRRLA